MLKLCPCQCVLNLQFGTGPGAFQRQHATTRLTRCPSRAGAHAADMQPCAGADSAPGMATSGGSGGSPGSAGPAMAGVHGAAGFGAAAAGFPPQVTGFGSL